MKQTLLAATIGLAATSTHAELLITGVFDGPLPGGLPKGVEVYATTDIADLAQYGLGGANNGGGSDGEEFSFPTGSAQAGDYVYIASESQGFTQFFGFAPDYTHGQAMSINGDDAIELFKNGAVIDRYGDPAVDGTGTQWAYQDGWAYRTDGASVSTTFDPGQWHYSGINALDGETANSDAASAFPLQSFTTDGGGENPEPPALTPISAIQGTPDTQTSNQYGESDVSPLMGQTVVVEAVVVGDFQNGDDDSRRNLNGFYLQEETADEDGDPRSSEGIFVYDAGTDVELGDRVRLAGTVDQYYGETQLSNVTELTVLAGEQLASVTPAHIDLAQNSATSTDQYGGYQPDLEAYEGMWVTFTGTLTITEQYQLDRFNEIKLVAGERPYQFTQQQTPDPSLYEQHQQNLGARTITYDDGLNEQNAPVDALDGYAPYNEANAQRMGDTISNATGVLDYKWAGNSASGATWRLRAQRDGANTFTAGANSPNPRPEAPEVAGDLRLASLNVLNYFTTLDDGSTTAVGLNPRGADNTDELARQQAKIVEAIAELNADVISLVEIENQFDETNDGSTAIETLVNAVNTRLGESVYDYVYPGTEFVGTDAIAVAMLYKTDTVTLADGSTPALLDDQAAATLPGFTSRDFASKPLFNGPATNRVALAASFTHRESGETFTLAANHFKSKGASGLEDDQSPNADQGDGAGYWNRRRLDAATALTEWLATAPTGIEDTDIAIAGDLNAYAMEAPIQYLQANGYTSVEPADAYSYVFDGQIGTLDYILLSDSLTNKLAGAETWHINADEADALDYNLDYGRPADYFNGDTPYRSSDHDPLVVGLNTETQALSLEALVRQYQMYLVAGELTGTGRWSVVQWLNGWRYRSVLNKAQWLASKGHQRPACALLQKAVKHADNQRRNNWVSGSALPAWQSALAATNRHSCP